MDKGKRIFIVCISLGGVVYAIHINNRGNLCKPSVQLLGGKVCKTSYWRERLHPRELAEIRFSRRKKMAKNFSYHCHTIIGKKPKPNPFHTKQKPHFSGLKCHVPTAQTPYPAYDKRTISGNRRAQSKSPSTIGNVPLESEWQEWGLC